MEKTRVVVWSEGIDPVLEPRAAAIYPDDINTYLASFLQQNADFTITCRNINDPENGLSQQIVDNTDVLLWWSHLYNDRVSDTVVERVVNAVLDGKMGLLLLHAGIHSKIAARLLGKNSTSGKYREVGEMERMWVVDRSHAAVAGLEKEYVEFPASEMYGEPYGMPTPDEIVFISWFEGGEVMRSGVSWRKGAGRVFYLAPGHEEFPVYANPELQKIIANVIRWLRPVQGPPITFHGEIGSLETIKNPVKT